MEIYESVAAHNNCNWETICVPCTRSLFFSIFNFSVSFSKLRTNRNWKLLHLSDLHFHCVDAQCFFSIFFFFSLIFICSYSVVDFVFIARCVRVAGAAVVHTQYHLIIFLKNHVIHTGQHYIHIMNIAIACANSTNRMLKITKYHIFLFKFFNHALLITSTRNKMRNRKKKNKKTEIKS